MKDFGLLLLRLVSGGLMAGHGAQKLFGAFEGPGFKGTSKWLEGMGLAPGEPWAAMAGGSEFGGGVLTAAGLLNPVGTLGTVGAMGMAATKVHWGKPIWSTKGGAELPVINMAIALALGVLGPGKYSLDNLLGIRLPRRVVLVPGLLATAATIGVALVVSNRAQAEAQKQPQAAEQPQEEQHKAVPVPAAPATSDHEESEPVAEPAMDQAALSTEDSASPS